MTVFHNKTDTVSNDTLAILFYNVRPLARDVDDIVTGINNESIDLQKYKSICQILLAK